MTTQDFIVALFCHVDQQMLDVPKRPDANFIRVKWSRSPSCLPSKAEGCGPSTAG